MCILNSGADPEILEREGGGVGKFESIKRMYILLSGAGPEILKGRIR